MGQFDCSKQLLRTHPEYCAKVLGMTYSRGYEGCRSLYPATSRLQSVPPRFYDVIDRDGSVLDSDMMHRGRARSVARNTSALGLRQSSVGISCHGAGVPVLLQSI